MGSFSNFHLRLCKSDTQQWGYYKTFSSSSTLESHGSTMVLIFGQVLSVSSHTQVYCIGTKLGLKHSQRTFPSTEAQQSFGFDKMRR